MRRIMNMADIPTGAKFLRVHVSGNCLKGAGIYDGDSVGVALGRFPRPPQYTPQGGVEREDFCVCCRLDKPGPVLVKRYDGRVFRPKDHAGTPIPEKGPDHSPGGACSPFP